MERADLIELLTPEGLALLERETARDDADPLSRVAGLRAEGHPPGLVATVLTQARLRRRAVAKFGAFAERMLFTPAGLEQATRLSVAARHAGRLRAAGATSVADLGCGIGGDALAFAGAGLEVLAVEADEVTAALASANLAPFPEARVVHARADEVDLSGVDVAWFDPARRTAGHEATRRLSDPEAWSPSLSLVVATGERMPTAAKLSPAADRALVPEGWEAQWVSVDGSVVELVISSPALARDGVARAALVLDGDAAHELTATGDAQDAEVGPLGDVLYEPDGAVIRARQIGEVARRVGGRMLDGSIAWITADELVPTPFATAFRVLERLPVRERELRRALATRGIGTLEIKKRGVDVDPATLRRRLALDGDAAATLVLTRSAGDRLALLVERV